MKYKQLTETQCVLKPVSSVSNYYSITFFLNGEGNRVKMQGIKFIFLFIFLKYLKETWSFTKQATYSSYMLLVFLKYAKRSWSILEIHKVNGNGVAKRYYRINRLFVNHCCIRYIFCVNLFTLFEQKWPMVWAFSLCFVIKTFFVTLLWKLFNAKRNLGIVVSCFFLFGIRLGVLLLLRGSAGGFLKRLLKRQFFFKRLVVLRKNFCVYFNKKHIGRLFIRQFGNAWKFFYVERF